ncbi:MAG TPA: YchF-related putative GTPase [Candidatus Bathyarchaeia archaeon]|nr:YchF-related putative GTPase [Candidatus Bathyarchaeia archaeon]
MIKIGIVGKTNTGKTTFFNASTGSTAEVSTYPFTTKKPNIATGQVQTLCVCRELHLKDKPKNSTCIDGWRFVPLEILDLPGLIKGAWAGRGLGTQFLNVVAQADALLHVVDASGSIDPEGKITRAGMGNPVLDVYDIEEELILWFKVAVDRALQRIRRRTFRKQGSYDGPLAKELAGIGVRREHVVQALAEAKLEDKFPKEWKDEDSRNFSEKLRAISKPTIIIANKMDLAYADKNFDKLRGEFKSQLVIPACSEAELALRRAQEKGFIQYIPGEETFQVLDESRLTKDQAWALAYVQQKVMTKLMRTGVQFALNSCIFKLLGMNAVYPVEDAKNLADKRGNVLPDVFLVPNGRTAKDLAQEIHSELAARMLYAIDARNGLRLPNDYILRDRDVISIVTAARKKE